MQDELSTRFYKQSPAKSKNLKSCKPSIEENPSTKNMWQGSYRAPANKRDRDPILQDSQVPQSRPLTNRSQFEKYYKSKFWRPSSQKSKKCSAMRSAKSKRSWKRPASIKRTSPAPWRIFITFFSLHWTGSIRIGRRMRKEKPSWQSTSRNTPFLIILINLLKRPFCAFEWKLTVKKTWSESV